MTIKEEDKYKLLVEQYKIMIGSTEKVIDARQKTNAFFLTIVTSIISLSLLIGKEFHFSNFSLFLMALLSAIALALSIFWHYTVDSYRKLNKGKFELIFELEKELQTDLYQREWDILKSKKVAYKETTLIEKYIVKTFIGITGLSTIIELLLALFYHQSCG